MIFQLGQIKFHLKKMIWLFVFRILRSA